MNNKLIIFILVIGVFAGITAIAESQTKYATEKSGRASLVPVERTFSLPSFNVSGTLKGLFKKKDALPQVQAVSLLSIPSINLAGVRVEEIGLTEQGRMDVPRKVANVGWYKYGSVPGEQGSAVMAGHVDDALGLPAVFSRLDELTAGDDIYVTGKDGKKLHFVVQNSVEYNVTDAPLETIFNDNSGRYLKLITCSGSVVGSAYDHRLVVTATLI